MSGVTRRRLLRNAALAAAAYRMGPRAVGQTSNEVMPGKFKPTWDSLKQWRMPEWFRDAKFGIWAHWSAQCVPEQGDWYARRMYMQGDHCYDFHVKTYGHPTKVGFKEIDHMWKAERWEPEKLLDLYVKTGAKYFMALACHHDNLDCFDSTHHNWNSVKVGPKKDIVGTWEKLVRARGIRFGVSNHSSHAWHWFQVAYGYDPEGARAGQRYDAWKLTKPVNYAANQANVKSLIDNLKELRLKDSIDTGKTQYATYDLDDDKAVHVQLYKDATGMRSSAVDEMKILHAAQRQLVEAEQKVVAIRKFIPKMQKETMIYRGGVQRFASTVHTDLPVAISKLDRLLATLEAYVSLSAGSPPDMATSTAELFGGGGAPSGGMTRATGGEPAPTAAPSTPQKPANFPQIERPQVALIHVEQLTGDPRSPDGAPVTGEPSYMVFETADEARRYAYEKVQADATLQCNILDPDGHLLHLMKAGDPPPPAKSYDGAV